MMEGGGRRRRRKKKKKEKKKIDRGEGREEEAGKKGRQKVRKRTES